MPHHIDSAKSPSANELADPSASKEGVHTGAGAEVSRFRQFPGVRRLSPAQRVCSHERVSPNEVTRLLSCHGCGANVEPFEWVLGLASREEHLLRVSEQYALQAELAIERASTAEAALDQLRSALIRVQEEFEQRRNELNELVEVLTALDDDPNARAVLNSLEESCVRDHIGNVSQERRAKD